jgi:hypothetical protein
VFCVFYYDKTSGQNPSFRPTHPLCLSCMW